jgi:hypothetical protein
MHKYYDNENKNGTSAMGKQKIKTRLLWGIFLERAIQNTK